MLGIRTNLSLVVSGGGSAATGLGCTPRSPTIPASVNPPRNLRRLNRLTCWVFMGTSLPNAGQCDPETAAQWTLLPSHEQAQHRRGRDAGYPTPPAQIPACGFSAPGSSVRLASAIP